MDLQPHEVEIIGNWILEGKRVVGDPNFRRIRWLVSNSFEKLSVGNWTILYRDRNDRRLWQQYHPHSELHGGGPESIRIISTYRAELEYGHEALHQRPTNTNLTTKHP